jgi:hypothetical protein
MKPRAAFLNDGLGPSLSEQILFADRLIGAAHQGNQDVQGSRSRFDRNTFPRKKPFAGDQAEGPSDRTSLVGAAGVVIDNRPQRHLLTKSHKP